MEAAFFDLDKTVIAKSSVLAFGRPLYREGLLSRSALLKSAYNQAIYRLRGADQARMERARDKMLSVTRGWEQARVSGVVRETFETIVAPIIYAEALELFEEHLDAGRKIFLVSSSPIEIVSHLAEYLGIDECIASRSRVDTDGRYTGELEFYAYGPHKAAAVREAAERDGIDLAASYAYSDSITDAPMLELVGHPVAVNPDRELARLARQREWEVREFDRPVRLRRRAPAPAPTAAVGGVLAAVGLGVAGYRWAQNRQKPGFSLGGFAAGLALGRRFAAAPRPGVGQRLALGHRG
jgi:HAD superfamily hydrolase (TIGR01490 family)